MLYLIGIVFLTIFVAANIYVGIKGLNIIKHIFPIVSVYLYWIIFTCIALSYIISIIGKNFFTVNIEKILNIIGSYWLAALVYFLIINLATTIIKISIKYMGINSLFKSDSKNIVLIVDFLAMIIVVLVLVYGTYNANNSKVVKYEVNIHKKAGNLEELNIVMVSDIHIGTIIGKSKVDKMVKSINELQPDVVLLGGDIIDNDIEPFINGHIDEAFKNIKCKYGVYAVLGNHEYIATNISKIQNVYEKSNINVLKDQIENVGNSFYIVGRDDVSSESFLREKRKSISELTYKGHKDMPIIVLDHQPINLNESKEAGVDLQFSGHTHKGQFFPTDWITKRMFQIDWGYLREHNFNIIVSSGYGTWGPPIRIGTNSEIVQAKVKFNK